jgi:hypothetical protein
MSLLHSLEQRIAGLVEGAFSRVFRSEIRPVELARRLAKEMDSHRTSSLSRTFVPNEYVVWLSTGDRERYAGVESSIIEELGAYMLEHARSENFALASRPVIEFRTDDRLALGECAIEARLVSDPGPEPVPAAAAAAAAAPSHTMVFSRAERISAPLEAARPTRAVVIAEGRRIAIPAHGAVIGRSRESDVVLAQSEISRRHAEIAPTTEGGWAISDLNSTNGVRVNGEPVGARVALHDGDVIELGTVPLRFEVQ